MNTVVTIVFIVFILASGFVFINIFLNIKARSINWKVHLIPLVIASVLCFVALLFSLLSAGNAIQNSNNSSTRSNSSKTSDNSLYK